MLPTKIEVASVGLAAREWHVCQGPPELAVGRLGFCWTHWSWIMLFDDFDVICGWFRGNHGNPWAKPLGYQQKT